MVQGCSPVGLTETSDVASALSKEFVDIQVTVKCRFTLKCVRDKIRIYSQTQNADRYSLAQFGEMVGCSFAN